MNDYVDAAERHYLSAEALQGVCAATASHCYGISGECVLKALMSNLHPQANRVSGKHMGDDLWSAFEGHSTLGGKPNLVTAAKQFKTLFDAWDIGHRYFNRTDLAFDPATVALQKQGAAGLRGLLQQVQQGLI
jgi:hypothetical protein